MVVKPFSQKINVNQAFDIQNVQHTERLVMNGTVDANSSNRFRTYVSNYGHFFCMFMTGYFTTLDEEDQTPVDNGISHLSGQMIDGAGQKNLFNARIPFDLWLSPGRTKSALVPAAAAGNNLFYPIEFEYLFTANTNIELDVANTGSYANTFTIMFHGIRIVTNLTVKNRIGSGGQVYIDKNQAI